MYTNVMYAVGEVVQLEAIVKPHSIYSENATLADVCHFTQPVTVYTGMKMCMKLLNFAPAR